MKMLINSLCFYSSKLHNVIVYFVCITGERGGAEATSATTTSGRGGGGGGGGGDGGTIAAGILVPLIIIVIIAISVVVALFLLWRSSYIDKGSLSLSLSLSFSLPLSPGGSLIALATSPSTMRPMKTVGPLHQDLLNPPNRLSQPLTRDLLLQFSTTSPMRGSSTNQTLLPEPMRLVSDLELCER